MAYADFKSYIQQNYHEMIEQEIIKYTRNSIETTLCEKEYENLSIRYLACHEELGSLIGMDAVVTVDIVSYGLGTKKIEFKRKTKWFNVFMHGELNNGLHDVGIYRIENYKFNEFRKEGALDEFLIPYIYSEDLEELAETFHDNYCWDAVYEGFRLPYNHIMRNMKIHAVESNLPDTVFGRMYFKPTRIKYWQNYYPLPKTEVEKEVPAGTMVINKNHHFMGAIGSELNTIAHELVHWEFHQKFFEILSLLDPTANELSCEVMPDVPSENMSGIQKAIWWAEWQANNLAPRIIMPRMQFLDVLAECYDDNFTPKFYSGERLEEALEKTAELFGVSKFAAKVRAIQLGIMEAEGTMLYSDKYYVCPISFKRSSLSTNQTFAIDKKAYRRLMDHENSFADLINKGAFVYAECFVVINDPLYVKYSDSPFMEDELVLTDYGREHADECCMKFERDFKYKGSFDVEYYGQCYLSKELTQDILVETKLTHDLINQNTIERGKISDRLKKEGSNLAKIKGDLPTSFSGTFNAHMKMAKKEDGKKMTNLQMSIETGLSEDYIAKLRKEEVQNLSIGTVCALCMGLHLPPYLSRDMVIKSRTGFPYNEEGYYQEIILENMYMEPLSDVNQLLREAGIKPWGKV